MKIIYVSVSATDNTRLLPLYPEAQGQFFDNVWQKK